MGHRCAARPLACTLYFTAYEYLHWCMHLPRKRHVERSGIFFRLNGHHLLHHRYLGKNFNVVLPLADLCCCTLLLRSKIAFAQAQGPSVPDVQPRGKNPFKVLGLPRPRRNEGQKRFPFRFRVGAPALTGGPRGRPASKSSLSLMTRCSNIVEASSSRINVSCLRNIVDMLVGINADMDEPAAICVVREKVFSLQVLVRVNIKPGSHSGFRFQ